MDIMDGHAVPLPAKLVSRYTVQLRSSFDSNHSSYEANKSTEIS